MSSNMDKSIDLRHKIRHFNVLVIGRANAGKTTLLKRVCNSIEDPEIFNPRGEKIGASVVEGSAERGEHDIENRLIFKSNPEFIFHDSRGFESGSVNETERVQAFITERAAIPVVAIFTKFDGLITKAFAQLKRGGATRQEAAAGANEKALEMLTTDFIEPLKSTTFHPEHYLHLSNMQEADSNSDKLMEKTANALNDDALRLLFVSVQQNNIALCTSYAVTK
ncbi:GTP-binding protein [Mycena olivaceomarginata]|nr:GTP-binding protein [Mycena olivaceomarginata]